MSARIFSTMPTSRKVPMCGLLTTRISSGAPAFTNSASTPLGFEAPQHAGLVLHVEVDGVDDHHRALLARVVAALEDGEALQVGIAKLQALDDGRAQRIVGVIQRQAQFGDSQHGARLS